MADAKEISQGALAALDAGGPLEDAIHDAIQVAILRGHSYEHAFFRFQFANLSPAPGELMAADLFNIWQQIDAEFPGDPATSKHVRNAVPKEYADSRTDPADPTKYSTGSISGMEDFIAECAMLENDPRGIQPELVPKCDLVRTVYARLRSRIVNYLKSAL